MSGKKKDKPLPGTTMESLPPEAPTQKDGGSLSVSRTVNYSSIATVIGVIALLWSVAGMSYVIYRGLDRAYRQGACTNWCEYHKRDLHEDYFKCLKKCGELK